MNILRNSIKVFTIIILGIVGLHSSFAQIPEIVLLHPDSLSIDTLKLEYKDNKFLGTFKIINSTGNNATSQKWQFSDNVNLEHCDGHPNNFNREQGTIKLQYSLPALTFSLKPDFEKSTFFYIKNETNNDVYKAILKYPILGYISLPDSVMMPKDSLVEIKVSIKNKGLEVLKAKIELISDKIDCKSIELKIDPESNKEIILTCQYKGEEIKKDEIEFSPKLKVSNLDFPKNSFESSISFRVFKSKEDFLSKKLTLPLWLLSLFIFLFITSIIFIFRLLFFKKINQKDLSKDKNGDSKIPESTSSMQKIHRDFSLIHSEFLSSALKHISDCREWPLEKQFSEVADKSVALAKNAFGQTEPILKMLDHTRESLRNNIPKYDESKFPQLVERSVLLCISIKEESFINSFTEVDSISTEYIENLIEDSKILNNIICINQELNKENVTSAIENLFNEQKSLAEAIEVANHEIEIKTESIKELESERNKLNEDIDKLKESLQKPNKLHLYKYYISNLVNTIDEIHKLNWKKYTRLKELFLRRLKGNDWDELVIYKKQIDEQHSFPESMTEQEVSSFSYMLSELFRMQSFSKFSPFKKVFSEIGFPFSKYEGILKTLEGFWLSAWELELIVPKIYTDTFDENLHIDIDSVSHIISQQIISVSEEERNIQSDTIRDFQYIGLISSKLGINRKAKVYSKK